MGNYYTIGLDYGTLSGRAVLVDADNGEVKAEAVKDYPHGVMDTQLPDGTPVPRGWAFQHPLDYLEVLEFIVPQVMRESGAAPEQIIGISADFTGCTLILLNQDGIPMCLLPEYEKNPLSWVNHWKHRGVTSYVTPVQELLREREPELLIRHGGKVSSEIMMPKILQILHEAPELFTHTDLIMEAGDWLTMQMTGRLVRSQSMAGFKAFWREDRGYPDGEFYAALDERLRDFAETRLRGEHLMIGQCAGSLTEQMARKLGLQAGTAVGVAQYDAHAAFPGAGISEPEGTAMLTLGTSGGFLVAACRKCAVQGTSSMTENGDLPGYFSYASGQACLGDCFGWFAKHMVPGECVQEAKEKKMPVQSLLMEKAAKLTPGESGLLALDWWNGNRSVLADAELSGLILGMTLKTRSEEIYRALLESAAFGTRRILESYEQAGLPVKKIHAVGGIVKKNPLLMQIYADVLNCPIYTCKSTQAAALGSAMFAAAAAGAKKGGYDTVREAVIHMSELEETPYLPIPEHAELYGKLYQEFCRLHDYFGCGGNDVMKQLKKIQCGNR